VVWTALALQFIFIQVFFEFSKKIIFSVSFAIFFDFTKYNNVQYFSFLLVFFIVQFLWSDVRAVAYPSNKFIEL